MVLDELQNRAVLGLLHRTGLIDTLYRWPNATLPYTIADGYFNAAQIEHLEYGLRIISNVTCYVYQICPSNERRKLRGSYSNSNKTTKFSKSLCRLKFRVNQMKDVGHMWVM